MTLTFAGVADSPNGTPPDYSRNRRLHRRRRPAHVTFFNAGSTTLTVSDTGRSTPRPVTFTVNPASSALIFSPCPPTKKNKTTSMTIALQDAYGNVGSTGSSSVTVTLSVTDNGASYPSGFSVGSITVPANASQSPAFDFIGGYCLVLKPPMVELGLLPEQVRERHPFVLNTSEQDLVSLPMLWLNKELRGPRHSVFLWMQMLASISGMGRKYLVYTYQLHEQRNWKLYKRASNPTNIYEGILANGGTGGVDYVPIQRLSRQIAFLARFSQRHVVPALEAIPA